MNTLTTGDIRRTLTNLRDIEKLTDAMRLNVRPPTPGELYPAAAAVQLIRNLLLSVALADVAVEPTPAPKVVVMAQAAE